MDLQDSLRTLSMPNPLELSSLEVLLLEVLELGLVGLPTEVDAEELDSTSTKGHPDFDILTWRSKTLSVLSITLPSKKVLNSEDFPSNLHKRKSYSTQLPHLQKNQSHS